MSVVVHKGNENAGHDIDHHYDSQEHLEIYEMARKPDMHCKFSQ